MDHILGQNRAIDVLETAFAAERLHHAYVFHGPWGVGKFTTALAFAKLLLCHDPQTDLSGRPTACGACASCRRLETEVAPDSEGDPDAPALATDHPDVHVVAKELARFHSDRDVRIRKQTNIPVGVLRTWLIDKAYQAPQLGHRKVFLVDEADLMDPVGQNALLKTLEEPPPGTFIILVTTHEDQLLPTIRSRCQRLAFVPLSDEAVGQWVQRYTPDLPAADRDWLIHDAAGSLGRAKLVIDYDLVQWARVLLPALDGMTQGRFPASLGEQLAKLIDDFAKAWVDKHANASKEAANKRAAALAFSVISQHARRRIASLGQQADPGDPIRAEQRLNPWLGVMDALDQAEAQLASNVNLGLVCDHLAADLFRSLARAAVGSAA